DVAGAAAEESREESSQKPDAENCPQRDLGDSRGWKGNVRGKSKAARLLDQVREVNSVLDGPCDLDLPGTPAPLERREAFPTNEHRQRDQDRRKGAAQHEVRE